LAVPAPIRAEVAGFDPSFMVRGLPATAAGTLGWGALRELDDLVSERDVWVLGPGCGRHPATDALLRRLMDRSDRPGICDADALNARAEVPVEASTTPAARIFLPHPGEAARLLEWSTVDVQADREAAARTLHRQLEGVVVLKGAGSLITDGDRIVRNLTGNSGLATGGSGDVLAGMVAGLVAQGMPPFEAAAGAVWLHGNAADELVDDGASVQGLSPLDLIELLRQGT